jgi:enoyl-CoA hydratase/carnithine racemase
MQYQTLIYDVGADLVATVTINRPEAMNSFTLQMLRDFEQVWATVQKDDRVNAVVLRAADGRAFSSGADVKAAQNEPIVDFGRPFEQRDPGEFLGPKSNGCWKPIITAVHGLCCAGAFYWVNESDIVICSEDAQFFDPHVSYGQVAAVEPIGLTYRIPYGEVMRMMLLGNDERINAFTAMRIGLVTEVVAGSHESLWQRAHELATKVANKPTMATQGTVRAVWESQDVPRSIAVTHAMKYPLLGNPTATAQVDRTSIMKSAKQFDVR